MICEKTVKAYCKDYNMIENYGAAIADTIQTWDCHHRMEEVFTSEELKRAGWYYDIKPQALIFLTHSDHIALHNRGNKYFLGKKHSEEHRAKLSAAHKGKHWKLVDGHRVWY